MKISYKQIGLEIQDKVMSIIKYRRRNSQRHLVADPQFKIISRSEQITKIVILTFEVTFKASQPLLKVFIDNVQCAESNEETWSKTIKTWRTNCLKLFLNMSIMSNVMYSVIWICHRDLSYVNQDRRISVNTRRSKLRNSNSISQSSHEQC